MVGTHIHAYDFKDFCIVKILTFGKTEIKKVFLKYEKDKGYLWIEDTIDFENFIVDKENNRLILLNIKECCTGDFIYKMIIYEINKRNITNYLIKAKIKKEEKRDSMIIKDSIDVITQSVTEGYLINNYFKKRNDTLFFYIKKREKFLKPEKFEIIKDGKYFTSFTKKIICFDKKNLTFNEVDTFTESFSYEEESDIRIYSGDTLSLLKGAFIFDKIKMIFKEDTGTFYIKNFNLNENLNTINFWRRRFISYFIEFEKNEYFENKKILLKYPFIIHNDSVYYPYKGQSEFIKEKGNELIKIIKKFEEIGIVDSLNKPIFHFEIKEKSVLSRIDFNIISDKFNIDFELMDTSKIQDFYDNIKLKLERSFKLISSCLKNKNFEKDIKELNKRVFRRNIPPYFVHVSQKEGNLPPYLKDGEIIIRVHIPKKGHPLKVKNIIYHLDERDNLIRWQKDKI